jgi:hypothetical protein
VIFAWDGWNQKHVQKHGSNRTDAEHAVRRAREPFPRDVGDDKYLVWGQTPSGRYLQVIFVIKLPEDVEFQSLTMLDWSAFIDSGATAAIYICHAMPMTERQISQYRKLRSSP